MNKPFSIRDAVPEPKDRQFPMCIEFKGRTVQILEIPNRKKPSYTVIYHVEGERERFNRREFEVAFTEAQTVVSHLGDGDGDFLPLTGKDRRIYERALDLLQPLGLSLDEVAAEAVDLANVSTAQGSRGTPWTTTSRRGPRSRPTSPSAPWSMNSSKPAAWRKWGRSTCATCAIAWVPSPTPSSARLVWSRRWPSTAI